MYFKQQLLKAFFDKIKTNHFKWLFVAEKSVIQVIFNLKKKHVDMDMKKSVLQSLILRSNRFVKKFKNMRSRSIKVEKI